MAAFAADLLVIAFTMINNLKRRTSILDLRLLPIRHFCSAATTCGMLLLAAGIVSALINAIQRIGVALRAIAIAVVVVLTQAEDGCQKALGILFEKAGAQLRLNQRNSLTHWFFR